MAYNKIYMMKWTDSRRQLKADCIDYKTLGFTDSKYNKKSRPAVLKKYNSTCSYCGGQYQKFLICSYYSDIDDSDTSCKFCYAITHLNYGFNNDLELYYSSLKQDEIVKKTVEYIIKNNSIPQPHDIDKDVKNVPISLIEYINIINYSDNNVLQDYKIFFGQQTNYEFIIANFGNTMNFFVNDNKIIKKQYDNKNITEDEKLLFEKIFTQ